jgi:hypothetical protein
MADDPEVRISVTRSGGVAGLRRGWCIESHEPGAWRPLVEACPWDEEPGTAGADRFVWRIEVSAPPPARTAELPETAVHGPWRALVERVREEGEPVRPDVPPPRRRPDRG